MDINTFSTYQENNNLFLEINIFLRTENNNLFYQK
jgi:hypothetical protein